MTEAETLEAVALYGDNAIGTFSLYISIIFAYLTVAYFVGAKLSRFQTIVVSGLYIAASAIVMVANIATIQAWTSVVATNPTILNTLRLYTLKWLPTYMAILLTLGIVVGLYFMHDVRKRAGGPQ